MTTVTMGTADSAQLSRLPAHYTPSLHHGDVISECE